MSERFLRELGDSVRAEIELWAEPALVEPKGRHDPFFDRFLPGRLFQICLL